MNDTICQLLESRSKEDVKLGIVTLLKTYTLDELKDISYFFIRSENLQGNPHHYIWIDLIDGDHDMNMGWKVDIYVLKDRSALLELYEDGNVQLCTNKQSINSYVDGNDDDDDEDYTIVEI